MNMRAGFFSSILLLLAAGLLLLNAAESQTGEEWLTIAPKVNVRGLKAPTHITHAGDSSNRLFVTEQRGRIMIVRNNTLVKTPFLDIVRKVSCCGERGLLSIAFPPDYRSKEYFYINYTNKSGDTVIARYRLSADPDRADPKSEKILLTIKQPYANHNGGQLAFGTDGYLYIGMGDGGSGGDPHNNGQNPAVLLGKILRIDVESGTSPYSIPKNNPFLNKKGYRPEIWSLGMRNPWRFSFDRKTGDLYIADVGQNLYEEIHFQPASSRGGENYGWSIMEGNHCYRSDPCDRSGLSLPVAEYDHSQGCSITGGMVYRGTKFPQLQGIYIYADYCSGRIWGLRHSGAAWRTSLLAETNHAISTFGEDEAGNLYFADHRSGTLYAIEASSS